MRQPVQRPACGNFALPVPMGPRYASAMQLIDPNHPFFRPAWRRWATGIFPIAWSAVELFALGNPIWAVIFLLLGIYAFWVLVIKGPDAA